MNRPYPLLVKPEEETSVRNAAKLINERIKTYKEKFSVQDDLDLVIMCCLEFATDNINQAEKRSVSMAEALDNLEKIDEALNTSILNTEEVPRSS